MTQPQKNRLTKQAFKLFTLGVEVERRREALRCLVTNGVPCNSTEMWEGLRSFQAAEREWSELEQEHLTLRGFLTERRYGA